MKYPKTKPQLVLVENLNGAFDFEQKLKALKAKKELRELQISFTGEKKMLFGGQITDTKAAADVLRLIIGNDVETQEHFIVVFCDTQNNPIGYLKHTKGTTISTLVDMKIIFAIALITLSQAILVCHNHPSGNLQPSMADKNTTKNLVSNAKLFDMAILDHIIITKNSYYSFREHGLLKGLRGVGSTPQKINPHLTQQIQTAVFQALKKVTLANSPFVYGQTQTKTGYTTMEERIISIMLTQGLQPEAIIPQIEQEYG